MARAHLYQLIKNIVHAIQTLAIIVGLGIIIAIIKQDGGSDTRLSYFLVLCLISLPFLIYQTIFPTFKITRRLANAYAHAIVDLLLVILWLAAFLAEIVWVKEGSENAEGWKKGDKVCEKFGEGSTNRCKLGQATIVIGIIICGLSGLATAFSIYGISFYRSHGCLPGQESPKDVEAKISAADRGEEQPLTPGSRLETQQAGHEHHTNDAHSTPSYSPEGNATLPERPMSWQLPAHPEYNSRLEHTDNDNDPEPPNPPHPDTYTTNQTSYHYSSPPPQHPSPPSASNPISNIYSQPTHAHDPFTFSPPASATSPPSYDSHTYTYPYDQTQPHSYRQSPPLAHHPHYSHHSHRTPSPPSPDRPTPHIRVDTAFANHNQNQRQNQRQNGRFGAGAGVGQGQGRTEYVERAHFPVGDYER